MKNISIFFNQCGDKFDNTIWKVENYFKFGKLYKVEKGWNGGNTLYHVNTDFFFIHGRNMWVHIYTH